jgi:pSer/pThr/pTyr-binding forkhead associated (FHA) protein
MITWELGQFCIRDLGSTVGTFVEGKAIPSNRPIALKNGVRIRIGKSEVFEFHLSR